MTSCGCPQKNPVGKEVGGDLCRFPNHPKRARRRGLRPLVPRGREGQRGGAGHEVSGGVSFPPQCSFCPVADASFILQAPRLPGRVEEGWWPRRAGEAGQRPPVQRREGLRGADAQPRLPLLPAGAAPRLDPRSGLGLQQSWAVRVSEQSSGSSQAIARVSGPGRSFPAGVSPPAAGCAHTHTHTRPSSPSIPLCSPGSRAVPVPSSGVHGPRRPLPGARRGAGRAREPGAGRGRRWGSVWLPPPLE